MYAFWKIFFITFGVVSIHSGILYFKLSGRNNNDDRMKVIIDTDAGGDDAVAILLALASPMVQVIAITCVYGNTDLVNVENNVLKILAVANRTDIPVYSGARKPLVRNYTAGYYFGKDGLGDFKFDKQITSSIDRSKNASAAMVDLSKQHLGNISILALGPLTNVAHAAELDQNFTRSVNRFYVMGSTDYPESEFNFELDPESTDIFLNSTVKKETLISPWSVVQKNKISKEWRTEILGRSNSEAINFLNKVENGVLKSLTHWFPADSVAVATMLWPDLVTSSLKARMSIHDQEPTKVSVDTNSTNKNVEIVKDFNVVAFQSKLMQYLS